MVRYLFYTIGDLTYQSPLVVVDIDYYARRCRSSNAAVVVVIVVVMVEVVVVVVVVVVVLAKIHFWLT